VALGSSRPIASEASSAMMRMGRLAGGSVASAWLVSIIYHVVLFAVMYALPWMTGLSHERPQTPVPFTSIVGDTDQRVVTLSPPPKLDTKAALIEPDPLEFRPDQFQSIPEEAALPQDSGQSILGIGTGGGEFAKYGFRVSSRDAGPEFFGLGSQARGARRIVYVVDRSGSMMTTLHGVINELKESISRLRRTQKFHVIFFNSGAPLENPPGRLVSAIRAQKEELFDFLDQVFPEGATNPEPAMRRALALEPDLIYFLTDGEFDAGLVDALDRLNHDRRAKIYTIAYFDRRGAELLEKIARAHGGKFRFFSELDLP